MNEISQESQKLYNKLKSKLQHISMLYKSVLTGEKCFFIGSFLLATLLIAILFDNLFHLDFVSRLFFFTAILGLFGYLLTTIVLYWRKTVTLDQAALLIEKKFPHLENSLINALQLGRQKIVSSFEIVNLLIQDTFNKIRTLQLTGAIDYKKILKRSAITILLAITCVFYAILFPSYFKNGLSRILNPFSNRRPILRTQISISPAGDISVLKGDDLIINAKLSGKLTDNVFIHYKIKGEKKEFALMNKTEVPAQFSFQFNKILKPIEFYIKASDAKTKKAHIKVIHPPLVTGIHFDITYPEYAGLNAESIFDSTGNIHVLKGSKITIKIKANKPASQLAQANLIINNEKTPLTKLSANGTDYFTTTLTALETIPYKIELIDNEGYKNAKDLGYVIEVKEDNHPIILLEDPEENLKVEKEDTVQLRARVKDDYGITEVSLHYAINTMSEKSIMLQTLTPPLKEVVVTYKWDLSTLNLKEGDTITFHLKALDNDALNGPHVAQTESTSINIMDLYDRRKIILKKLDGDLALLKKLFLSEFVLKEKIKPYVADSSNLDEVGKIISRQEKVNLKIKDLELSLKNLKQKQEIDEENKLSLLWMIASELVTKDIYSYEVELVKMFHSDRLKDKSPIIKEIAAWQNNFSKKLLQLWQRTIVTYGDIYLKTILDRLNQCISAEETIQKAVVPLMKRKEKASKSLITEQKQITQKIKEFVSDVSTSLHNTKQTMLDNTFSEVLQQVHDAFLKDGHIYSYMNKATNGIKSNDIEAALKNLSMTISKLQNLKLDLLNPLQKETSKKIKVLISFLKNISERVSKLLDIEKSTLIYLNNNKLSGTSTYSIDLINYHARIHGIMLAMIENMHNKPKEETSKFANGLKYLEEASADKQKQISSLQRSNIHQAIFNTKTTIKNLEKSLNYFTKVKEKVNQIKKKGIKSKTEEKTEDMTKPRIKFLKPGTDVVVLPNAEIPLIIEAKDDYGVASIDLIYQILPGNKEEIVNIGRYPELKETVRVTYNLRLKTLGIKEKTTITYYAQAVDDDILQKNVSRSRSYQITAIPADLLQEPKKTVQEENQTTQKVKDLVKEILVVTFTEQVKLQEEVEKLKSNKILLSKELKERYNTLIVRQKMLQKEINSVLEIIQNIDPNVTGKKVIPFIERVTNILVEISTQDMPKIIDQLETLKQAAETS